MGPLFPTKLPWYHMAWFIPVLYAAYVIAVSYDFSKGVFSKLKRR